MEEDYVPQAKVTPPPPPLQLRIATPHLACETRQTKGPDPELDTIRDDADSQG
jgi:hypothetical protein